MTSTTKHTHCVSSWTDGLQTRELQLAFAADDLKLR